MPQRPAGPPSLGRLSRLRQHAPPRRRGRCCSNFRSLVGEDPDACFAGRAQQSEGLETTTRRFYVSPTDKSGAARRPLLLGEGDRALRRPTGPDRRDSFVASAVVRAPERGRIPVSLNQASRVHRGNSSSSTKRASRHPRKMEPSAQRGWRRLVRDYAGRVSSPADRGGANEPRPSSIIVSPERPSKACVWPGTVQPEGRGRLDASRSEGRHRVTVASPFVERRQRGASGTTSRGNSPKVVTSAGTEPGSRRWRRCCRFRGRRARVVRCEP
jgi:hypothetical protein